MKTLSLEQMECVSGGSKAGLACGGLMLGWGTILSWGLAAAPASAGISVGVAVAAGAIWGGISLALCEVVGNA